MNRRELIRILSGCLVTGAVAGPSLETWAGAAPRIRWAQGYLLWRNFMEKPPTLRDAFGDLKSVGANGIEFSPLASELQQNNLTPESLKQVLREHGLAIAGNYFSAPFYDTTRREEILRDAEIRFALLREYDARNIIIGPPAMKETDLAARRKMIHAQAPLLNEIGRRATAQGISIGIHPHLNTLVETSAETDLAMETTDPRYVGLSADTGHLYLAGADVLAVLRRHKARLNYFHFKDAVRPFVRPAFKPNLRELGRGEVDFPAIMRLLKNMRWQGWINIEQDATTLTPADSCRISMEYVNKTLKPIYT
ncbi:MAG: sugar phosphate isomerase/epimerase family protein [Blastocatellia bacterium]